VSASARRFRTRLLPYRTAASPRNRAPGNSSTHKLGVDVRLSAFDKPSAPSEHASIPVRNDNAMPRALLLILLSMLLPNLSVAQESPTMPSPPAWLEALDALYDADLRVAGLEERDFQPEQWWDVALPLATEARGFHVEEIGRSVEDRPLRHVSWGKGKTRVFLWSQMHGDERPASMALTDLFRVLGEHPDHPLVQLLRERTSLHFMPIVNPGGAARLQRRNAQGVDVNRDARALATREGRALLEVRERRKPDFGFNPHDHGVGTRAGDSDSGTAVALLAAAYKDARLVTD